MEDLNQEIKRKLMEDIDEVRASRKNNEEIQEVAQLVESEQKKELVAPNSSLDNSIDNSITDTIICDNQEIINSEVHEGNKTGSFDPFAPNDDTKPIEAPHTFETEVKPVEELSEWQKIYRKNSSSLIDNLDYIGFIKRFDVDYPAGKKLIILKIICEIEGEEIEMKCFFNDNPNCVNTSFDKIRDLMSKIDLSLEEKHLQNINTLVAAIEPLLGAKIELTPFTKIDSSGKEHKNYKVIAVWREDI